MTVCRDLDSLGVVGAVAPTDFEESSFCNLNFLTNVPLPSVFGKVFENLHPQFQNPNQAPGMVLPG